MRTTPQLYTLKYLKIPLRSYFESVNAVNHGVPRPIEREGTCPRGFTDNCAQCQHVRLWTDTSHTYFECLDMNYNNIHIVVLPLNPSDKAPNAIDTHVVVSYREIILLEADLTLAISDGESLEDISSGINYSQLSSYIPYLKNIIDSTFLGNLTNEQIYLEESKT